MNFMSPHTGPYIRAKGCKTMETENQETEMDNDEEDAPVIVPDAQAEEVADPVEAIPAVPITPAAPISLDEMLALGGTNIQTGLHGLCGRIAPMGRARLRHCWLPSPVCGTSMRMAERLPGRLAWQLTASRQTLRISRPA